MWAPLNKNTQGEHVKKDRGLICKTPIQPPGTHLSDELREAEDGPVVEDGVIEDVGQHPGQGVEGAPSRQLLPAELEAEAGVVQAANGQRELQQVVLIFGLVPPSLQSRQERTAREWQGGTSSNLRGRRFLPRVEQ